MARLVPDTKCLSAQRIYARNEDLPITHDVDLVKRSPCQTPADMSETRIRAAVDRYFAATVNDDTTCLRASVVEARAGKTRRKGAGRTAFGGQVRTTESTKGERSREWWLRRYWGFIQSGLRGEVCEVLPKQV